MCSLTWPVSEVVWSPGEVVGRVEAVLGRLVVGVVQNGEEEGLHDGEGGVVQEGGGGEDDVDLQKQGSQVTVT